MKTINQVIEEGKKEFNKTFPFIPHNDNFGADGEVTGGSDISREVQHFIFTDYTTSLLKAVEENYGDYKISWDIAEGRDNWVVQIWKGQTLMAQLDKKSDEGGCFTLSELTKLLTSKE